MTDFLKRLPDLLYPRRCPLCDGILRTGEPYICRSCSKKTVFRRGNTCVKCGREMPSEGICCAECSGRGYPFEECFAPFAYQGLIRDSILRFKYHDRPEYAAFYAAALFYYGWEKINAWEPDALVPVPAHRTRLASRGYNQALLIAEELSGLTGIPVRKDLVVREKRTEAQKELGFEERKKNLSGAFVYSGKGPAPETVLIVDDIFTTGSTISMITDLLLDTGTKRVYGSCICS